MTRSSPAFIPARSVLSSHPERGATLVEMTIAAFLMVMLLLGIVEISRMMVVYTALSNAARAGTRYAIVHGYDRTGSGASGPSTSGSSAQVTTAVKNFAGAGLLDTSQLVVTVTYPDSTPCESAASAISNCPGNRVTVKVTYPFTPFTRYFPLSTTLGNTSQGVITF